MKGQKQSTPTRPFKVRMQLFLRTWLFRFGVIAFVFFIWMLFLFDWPGSVESARSKTKRITSSFQLSSSADDLPNHLVIVPGHAVLNIDQTTIDTLNSEKAWKLLDYQEKQGLPQIISSHIQTALNITRSDEKSVLLFSGGQTRVDAGPISEGLSYYIYSKKMKWLEDIESQVFVEEYSRDSLENLMFSLCRFKEVTGRYPSQVTVVGFDLKKERYSTLHREAVDFPISSFSYVGLKPLSLTFNHNTAAAGEQKTVSSFQHNMYGCSFLPSPVYHGQSNLRGGINHTKQNTEPTSSEIVAKRLARNPFKRSIPYELSCSEMGPLFRWCGPEKFGADSFRHYSLPWNRIV